MNPGTEISDAVSIEVHPTLTCSRSNNMFEVATRIWKIGVITKVLYLAQVACRARFNKGRLGSQAEAVHMAPRLQVVQAIHDDVKGFEEIHVILGLLDIALCNRSFLNHPEVLIEFL